MHLPQARRRFTTRSSRRSSDCVTALTLDVATTYEPDLIRDLVEGIQLLDNSLTDDRLLAHPDLRQLIDGTNAVGHPHAHTPRPHLVGPVLAPEPPGRTRRTAGAPDPVGPRRRRLPPRAEAQEEL